MRLIDAEYLLYGMGMFSEKENGTEFMKGVDAVDKMIEDAQTIEPSGWMPCECGGTVLPFAENKLSRNGTNGGAPMTTSEPTTGELIEALRCDGVIKPCEGCFFAFQIENCSAMGCRTDDMFGLAADRLESQERTVAEKDAQIASLTARAEQAERERDAAKADMKLIVDAVRETHCDETCCFACKHDCDTSINDSGEFNNECPGFYKDDCFEWRGLPQEGDKDE